MTVNRPMARRLARLQRWSGDLGFLIAGLLLIVAGAIAVVWPLWYLATRYVFAYTLVCLGAIAAVIVWIIVHRIQKYRTKHYG